MKRLFWVAMAMIVIFLFLSSQCAQCASAGFKEEQKKFSRVREAYQLREAAVKNIFEEKGLKYPPKQIFFRVFKAEGKFEIWVVGREKKFVLLKKYEIPSVLARFIGPKRRYGDCLVPEGFYTIVVFNHNSKFHLSLGLNYPNEMDKLAGAGDNDLGGDIFIHGGHTSMGCIPLTNEGIQEVYLLAVEARNSGQKNIPVHIFPSRLLMERDALEVVTPEYNQALIEFWKNLREGYIFFETHKILPRIEVKKKKYVFVFQKPKS